MGEATLPSGRFSQRAHSLPLLPAAKRKRIRLAFGAAFSAAGRALLASFRCEKRIGRQRIFIAGILSLLPVRKAGLAALPNYGNEIYAIQKN
jgi:hypothetical protein